MAKKYDIKRIDGELYAKIGTVHRNVKKDDIADLYYGALDQKIISRLNRKAAGEIYSQISIIPSIKVTPDDIQQNPNLIAGLDAVLDLETHRIYEADQVPPSFVGLNVEVKKIGKGSGRAYDHFLSTTFGGDDAIIQRFEETQAAILTMYPVKKIFLYFGNRDCGKSVIEKLDIKILENPSGFGKLRQHIMPLGDINELATELGVADAKDKHLIICGDTSMVPLKENTIAVLKQLSGGDLVRGRMRYKDYTSDEFRGKILLLSNRQLTVGNDDAMINRVVMVPFPHTIPDNEQILNLEKLLYKEYSYILGRFFDRIPKLFDSNFKQFAEIEDDDAWVSPKNIGAEESVISFCKQCVISDSENNTFMTCQELYQVYKEFCAAAGLEAISSITEFGKNFQTSCRDVASCKYV